jgi:hypothetical protein
VQSVQHGILRDIILVEKGLKVFDKAGAEAVVSEMQQLHERKVLKPNTSNMMTKDKKGKSLHYYLVFLE